MRFHYGNAPESPAPEAEGWQPMPALGAKRVQNYGLLAACAGVLLVGLLLRGLPRPSTLWMALVLMIVTVPLHELVHALSTPALGFSDQTLIGIQGGKGLLLPYMVYDGIQPVWRMLLTGLAPFLFLTLLPALFLLASPGSSALRADLGFLAFYNMALSGGDLVNIFWISAHLPMRASVRRQGWGLLWKL